MRRTLLPILFLAAWLVSSVSFAADANLSRPNIVFFIADDFSVKDCSAYGETNIPSPNFQALAKEGMTFDRAFAASPTCAPSRAALLTGCYSVRNGSMFNQQRANAQIKKWPAYFKDLGYEVVAIGKVAHYAQVTEYGFDYADFFNYHQDVCIEKAVAWLTARKSDKPLCLLVGTNFPHVPWPKKGILSPETVQLPAKNVDTPETRQARTHYDAAVQRADSDLSLIRDAVGKALPVDNTLFVFSADQGAQWPFAKWTLYDAGLRVPLIIKWPGHIQAGKRTDAMVSWIDILPTLLDAAGVESKTVAGDIDGKSFWPVLSGKTNEHRDRIFASHSGDGNVNFFPSRAVRLGNWKYIRNLSPETEFHTHADRKPQDTNYFPSWVEKAKTDASAAAIIDQYLHRPAEELYDLSADPDETKNLAADPAHADQLKRAKAALDEWMQANHDQGLASDMAAKPPRVKVPPPGPQPEPMPD